jgi:hypothetical protein
VRHKSLHGFAQSRGDGIGAGAAHGVKEVFNLVDFY